MFGDVTVPFGPEVRKCRLRTLILISAILLESIEQSARCRVYEW